MIEGDDGHLPTTVRLLGHGGVADTKPRGRGSYGRSRRSRPRTGRSRPRTCRIQLHVRGQDLPWPRSPFALPGSTALRVVRAELGLRAPGAYHHALRWCRMAAALRPQPKCQQARKTDPPELRVRSLPAGLSKRWNFNSVLPVALIPCVQEGQFDFARRARCGLPCADVGFEGVVPRQEVGDGLFKRADAQARLAGAGR